MLFFGVIYLCVTLSVCQAGDKKVSKGPKHYSVTTLVEAPYVSQKHPNGFEGMLIDILDAIATRLNFTYDIHVAKDGKYGFEAEPGQWNGMIGELVNNESDIAVAPLTIASKRSSVIKYTQPWMLASLKILYQESDPWANREPLFVLLTPFTAGLWVVVLLLFIAVGVLFFIIGKCSPYEDIAFVGKAATYEGLTLFNSFLYTFSSLTWQGYTAAPRSLSGRILAAFWWIFSLLVIVTFTANLTALFLTLEPNIRTTPFMTFDELSRQREVVYGVLNHGATQRYFNRSKRDVEKRMWAQMLAAKPSVFFDTIPEGIQRVRTSNRKFALIVEGPRAEFEAEQEPCDLIVLGEHFTEHGYGFACSINTDLCDKINTELLDLREQDFIHDVRKKWMYSGCNAKRTEEYMFHGLPFFDTFGSTPDVTMETAVTLRRFAGAFMLLLIGIIMSVLVMVGEIFYKRHRGFSRPSRIRMPDVDRIGEPFDETT